MLKVAALLLAMTASVYAGERSSTHIRAFKRENPCPSTGLRQGSCPGYVIDHIDPICAGGPDHPSNMQWQTREESYKKDAEERRLCRAIKNRLKGG
jgi:hypothetical protein